MKLIKCKQCGMLVPVHLAECGYCHMEPAEKAVEIFRHYFRKREDGRQIFEALCKIMEDPQ